MEKAAAQTLLPISQTRKAFYALTWSFIETCCNQGITFLINLVLARILMPHDFGLIGVLMVVISIAQSFIDSGASQALIRKLDCTAEDYSTVFIYNLLGSVFFYGCVLLSSGFVARFFNEPQLRLLLNIGCVSLVINAFSLIQRTQLVKRLEFKISAKISVVSSLIAGAVTIVMALKGFGAISLVVNSTLSYFFSTAFFWIQCRWRPVWVFSKRSFRDLYSFGWPLMVSSVIDTVFVNVYNVIIGKYFSIAQLGYYTTANQLQSLPSQNLFAVIQRVTYPLLCNMQDDDRDLKITYKKILETSMMVSFACMLGLAAIAKPLIVTLIGNKWLPAVPYLQLMCFTGMLYPLHSVNLNILKVKGFSRQFLKLEILKKIFVVPCAFIGLYYGIKPMLVAVFFSSLAGYYINSQLSGKLINFPITEQLKGIAPSLAIAVVAMTPVYLLTVFFTGGGLTLLITQVLLGAGLVITLADLARLKSYLFIRNFVTVNLLRKPVQ